MNNLRLDENHVYWLGDKKIPGFSEIIQDLGISDTTHYKPEHSQKGKDIHELCDLIDQHPLVLTSEYEGYGNAWVKFKEDYKFEVKEIELQMYHPILMYAGTIDRVGTSTGISTMVDIKSGQPQKWHHLQLSAYLQMYKANTDAYSIDSLMIVYLKEDGSYKMVPAEDQIDLWYSCLRVYRYKHG